MDLKNIYNSVVHFFSFQMNLATKMVVVLRRKPLPLRPSPKRPKNPKLPKKTKNRQRWCQRIATGTLKRTAGVFVNCQMRRKKRRENRE